MPEKFEYIIDGKNYFQKTLVWGQVKQMKAVLPSLAIPAGMPIQQGLFFALGDHLPLLVAIVLIPEGGNPKDKDIEALAADFEFTLTPEMALQVISDFFDCNPIASLAEKLSGIAKMIQERIKKATPQATPSTKSFSSSPEGISSEETKSSGDSPQENPSPISGMESVN